MIELADVISQLRDELERARTAAEGETLRFELGPVDLEVTVALGQDGAAGGKIRFWVIEAGMDGKVSSASTQRIRLTLHPKIATSERADERSASPVSVYVSGTAVTGER